MIRRHVTSNRPREDVIDLGVTLDTATVPFVCASVPEVGRTVAPVSHRITVIRDPVTFVGHTVTLVSGELPLVQLTRFLIVHSVHQHRQSQEGRHPPLRPALPLPRVRPPITVKRVTLRGQRPARER